MLIQIVLSQCFRTPLRHDPFDLYRALRCINPSPYMFYLDLEELELAGRRRKSWCVWRKTGWNCVPLPGPGIGATTPEQDKALEEELLADPKERAEHIMLVDLGRNDVGRVAAIGSVKVTDCLPWSAIPM